MNLSAGTEILYVVNEKGDLILQNLEKKEQEDGCDVNNQDACAGQEEEEEQQENNEPENLHYRLGRLEAENKILKQRLEAEENQQRELEHQKLRKELGLDNCGQCGAC